MLLYKIFQALSYLLYILNLAIFVYCICTWVAPRSRVRYWLESFIEPVVSPFRRLNDAIQRRWGSPVDFSCLFAMIAINIVSNLLGKIYMLIR